MKYFKTLNAIVFTGALMFSACTSNNSEKTTTDTVKTDTDTIATIENARPAENAPVNNDLKPDSLK